MAAKAILVLCAQALLIQSTFSQCLGRAGLYDGLAAPFGLAGRGWDYDGVGLGCGCGGLIDITATSGGGFPVTSTSAIPPYGLSVDSENVYDGVLAAAGELPFVGTVAVDGVLPTAGAGAVNYGCGNGNTAMVSEAMPAAAAFSPAIGAFGSAIGGFGPAAIAAPGLGYGANWAGPGCGCGF